MQVESRKFKVELHKSNCESRKSDCKLLQFALDLSTSALPPPVRIWHFDFRTCSSGFSTAEINSLHPPIITMLRIVLLTLRNHSVTFRMG